MKLLFFSLTLALVAPLAACTSNNSVASNTLQSPMTQSSPAPKVTPVSLTNNWYKYTDNDSKYTAMFPGQPKETDQSKIVKYHDKAKNRVYLTSSSKIPVAPNQYNAEKGLDAARDNLVEVGNTITSENKITLNGFPGRELIMQNKLDMAIKVRIFIDPNSPTSFIALVLAGNGNLNFPEAEVFLNSLTVSKQQLAMPGLL